MGEQISPRVVIFAGTKANSGQVWIGDGDGDSDQEGNNDDADEDDDDDVSLKYLPTGVSLFPNQSPIILKPLDILYSYVGAKQLWCLSLGLFFLVFSCIYGHLI